MKSIKFRSSKHKGDDIEIISGVAFEGGKEEVIKFGFMITPYSLGLLVEKKSLGIKVYDAFNEVFRKYGIELDFERMPTIPSVGGMSHLWCGVEHKGGE